MRAPRFECSDNLPGVERFDWQERVAKVGEENLSGYTQVEKAYILDKATRAAFLVVGGEKLNDFARGWTWCGEEVSREKFADLVAAHPDDMIWVRCFDGFWSVRHFNE